MVYYHHSPAKAEEDIKKLCCILYLAEFFLDSSYQRGSENPVQKSAEELEQAKWAADCLETDLERVAAIIDNFQQEMRTKIV